MPNQKQLRDKKRKADKTIKKMVGVILFSILFLIGTAGAFDNNLIESLQAILQTIIAMIVIALAQLTITKNEHTKQHLYNRLDRVESQTKNQHTVIRNKRLSTWSPHQPQKF